MHAWIAAKTPRKFCVSCRYHPLKSTKWVFGDVGGTSLARSVRVPSDRVLSETGAPLHRGLSPRPRPNPLCEARACVRTKCRLPAAFTPSGSRSILSPTNPVSMLCPSTQLQALAVTHLSLSRSGAYSFPGGHVVRHWQPRSLTTA